MKQILPIITFIFCGFYSISQTTLIPDSNFEQSLIDLGIDTNGLTGDILNSDASSVTSLVLEFADINDITGIEAFTSLVTLNLQFNSIQLLDLTANLELVTVLCAYNGINTVDVSNNIMLETLDLTYNNISEVDLSQNVNLKSFGCIGSNATTFDLTNNVLLEQLYIRESPNLTNINLSQNPNLNYIDLADCPSLSNVDFTQNLLIEELYFQNCNITLLDLSNNSALRRLWTNDNPLLESLNVQNGNNTNINSFYADDCPNLTCIQVDNVSYSEANWSNIDAQTSFSLDCSNLSVNEFDSFDVNLYPNPVKNKLFIETHIDSDFIVFDVYGKDVFNGKIDAGVNNLDISNLNNGIYFINLSNTLGFSIKKFVKY